MTRAFLTARPTRSYVASTNVAPQRCVGCWQPHATRTSMGRLLPDSPMGDGRLPAAGVIAAEIVEDLEAALAEFTELAESLPWNRLGLQTEAG